MTPSAVRWLRRRIPAPLKRGLRAWWPAVRPTVDDKIARYLAEGRIPWGLGYAEYRTRYVERLVTDERLLEMFRKGEPLPRGHGERLDERVVEYPWVLSRARDWGPRVLDAGSTLNFAEFLGHPALEGREIIVYNLVHDWMARRTRVSYIAGDLRDMVLRDDVVDVVVCISTLEHIGFDNTLLYTQDRRYREQRPTDYQRALREFRRVLRLGGRLLLTVPFGKPGHHGWFQQFDGEGLEQIVRTFAGAVHEIAYFKYEPTGWRRASPEACAACEYFDVHAKRSPDPDYAAAARAVACLDLTKERR
jgi:SAM-dependent methyltransferase